MHSGSWRFILVVLASTCFAAPAVAADGLIGIYTDLSATQTALTFSVGAPRTLYVMARLDGLTAEGMSGAEYRVDGLPAGWVSVATPNPAAAIALGDPFNSVGGVRRANIAFQYCTGGSNGLVLLHTVVIIPLTEIVPTDLQVVVADPPTNPTYVTPVLLRCNRPEYTPVVAAGGVFHLATRGTHDLDYPEKNGYDSARGVLPEKGLPGEVFHFRVVYFSADGELPAPGSPRLELDANFDGDAEDPGEGIFTMAPMDQDSTLTNGKEYRYDVALGEPAGSRFRYRFTAFDAQSAPVGGNATAWRDSLVVGGGLVNLNVNAVDIRVFPSHPLAGEGCAIFARLRNLADRSANGTRVRIEDVFGNPIAERTLSELGPRASTEVAAHWRFMDGGMQPVVVRIDPGPGLSETAASDNAASHAVFVGGPGTTGELAIGGLPPLVTVPAVAPFGFTGNATYTTRGLPVTPLRGGWVLVRPSWDAQRSVRTDASGSFSASFVAPAQLGAYTIAVVVGDGACADSTVVSVQVTSPSGEEPVHGANLVVGLTATGGPGCPPGEATINWTVGNRGDRESSPTTVRLLLNGVDVVHEVAVGALLPGANAVLASFDAPLEGSGLHAFSARVDPASTVPELHEDDNLAVARLWVPKACLDLALDSMQFPGYRTCVGETLGMVARVSNRGCTAGLPARVVCRSGSTEIGSAPIPALAPGAGADVFFTVLPAAATCADFTLVVDPEAAAGTDCDLSSNGLGTSACVGTCDVAPPPPRPDFAVLPCDLSAAPSRAAAGDTVRFQAKVRNLGPVTSAAGALVVFRVGDVPVGAAVAAPAIQAGGWVVVESAAGWQVVLEPATLTVSIDPNGQAEVASDNNSTSRPLPWDLRPLALPECLPPYPVMFSTCRICRNVPFRTHAEVANDGLLACDSVRVTFMVESPAVAEFGTLILASVPAGASTCVPAVPAEVTGFTSSMGAVRIAALVDPANQHPEFDESNNRFARTVSVTCSASPDLVAAPRLPDGVSPQPGDTVRAVIVEVRNRGQAIARSAQARLQLDGVTLCDLEMGDIAPGDTSRVACETPWVAMAGCSQRLQACADPHNVIGESDESNNCTTSGISPGLTTDLAVYPYSIRVTPPSPAAGEQVLIQVSLHSLRRVASNCRVTVAWSVLGGEWQTLQDVSLTVPGGFDILENAVSFYWTMPPLPKVDLRFQVLDVCPFDIRTDNNVAFGTLPWFEGPNSPVAVTDFGAESTPDGVVVRWRSDTGDAEFTLQRRLEGDVDWDFLPAPEPAEHEAQGVRYEVLDRAAEPGARLEYRLLVVEAEEIRIVGHVSLRHDAALPRRLALHPLRPNPFRDGTVVEFSVPEPRALEIGVFDAAGRRLVVLRSGVQPAGRHAVNWDGRDAGGRRLPAGVYFCRLAAGGVVHTQRVVLVH